MDYDDGLIQTTPDALVIRRYNLLLAPKIIPYDTIKAVEQMTAGWINGRGRLWGTTIPGTWLNLDFKRSSKRVAFKIDIGAKVTPVITPDDPDRLAAALREHGVATG
jgi:hypothetical protein